MPNLELTNYITAARSKGIPDETIKSQLVSSGWPEAAVAESLAPQTQVPQPPNLPPQQAMIPGSTFPTSQNPLSNNFVTTLKNNWLKLAIALVVIIVIIGGSIFAYRFFTKEDGGKTGTSDKSSTSTQTNTNSKQEEKNPEKIFDVPSLLKKPSRGQLKSELGKIEDTGKGWIIFRKFDYSLSAYYELDFSVSPSVETDKFRYISVSIPQELDNIKDKKTIFKALNLTEGSDKYKIKIWRNANNQDMIISVNVFPPGSTDSALND